MNTVLMESQHKQKMSHLLNSDQRDIWIMNQVNKSSSVAYNEYIRVLCKTELNLDLLQLALNNVCLNNPLLTGRIDEEGLSYQENLKATPAIDSKDFSGQPAQIVNDWIVEHVTREFDLAKGPMLRCLFCKIDPSPTYFLVVIGHHIVADGWSLNAITTELFSQYLDLSQGKTTDRKLNSFQDYIEKEKVITETNSIEAMEYWETTLAKPLPVGALPTVKGRPAVKTYQGQHLTFRINEDLRTQLLAQAKQQHSTLFNLLLGAFSLVLQRYSSAEDLIVGVPCNKRMPGMDCIGHCTSLLPIRISSDLSPNFSQYLHKLRRTIFEAFDNRYVDFNLLLKQLEMEWQLSHANPLTDIVFNLDVWQQTAEMKALNAEIMVESQSSFSTNYFLETGIAKYDLFMNIVDTQSSLEAVVEFNSDIFSNQFISSFTACYEYVLSQIAAGIDKPLHAYELLSKDEYQKIIYEFNNTDSHFPKDKLLYELFEEVVDYHPNDIALIEDETTFSYSTLKNKVDHLASILRAHGLETGYPVILALDRCSEYIIALLAAIKLGCPYVPLDPSLPNDRISLILGSFNHPLILSKSTFRDRIAENLKPIFLDKLEDIELESVATPACQDPQEATAYIIFTSGSTGVPKGVKISHAAISRVVLNTNYINIKSDDRISQICDLSFDVSMFEIWGALLNGASLVLFKKSEIIDYQVLGRKLQKHNVTIGSYSTALLHNIISLAPEILATYKQLIVVGDILDPIYAQDFAGRFPHCKLINAYGPTEATIFATSYEVPSNFFHDSVPIGKPIANTSIYILDSYLQPVPFGVVGELYIGGIGVAQGYLNDDEKTNLRFIPNHFSGNPSERMYKTGDLAKMLPDGTIVFIGRVDAQVKLQGYRVDLAEIETILRGHPWVSEAVVMSAINQEAGKTLHSYVSLTAYSSEWLDELGGDEDNAAWQTVWNKAYEALEGNLSGRALAGWQDDRGKLFTAEVMSDWVESTVAKIAQLKPQRILEIGCGSGLLLERLAPSCGSYVALDTSTNALKYVSHICKANNYKNVTLYEGSADNLGIDHDEFDVVIINSVIQYFPSTNYLIRVLDQILNKVAKKAFIFLGDVRPQKLNHLFHLGKIVAQAEDTMSLSKLYSLMNDQLLQEKELLIDPEFFASYAANYEQITSIVVSLREDRHLTEMSKFRYDVVLAVGDHHTHLTLPLLEQDWSKNNLTTERLVSILEERKPRVVIRNIPNNRLAYENYLNKQFSEKSAQATVGHLKRQWQVDCTEAIDPNVIKVIATDNDYVVNITWEDSNDGSFLAEFILKNTTQPLIDYFHREKKMCGVAANSPALSQHLKDIVANIKQYLREKLPDYMVPSKIQLLAKMPVNSSSKVNRTFLRSLEVAEHEDYVAPCNALEQVLHQTITEILGIPKLSMTANLFNKGMHSLLIIRLSMALRQHNISIRPQTIYAYPSLAELAKYIQTNAAQDLVVNTSSAITFSVHSPSIYHPVATNLGTILLTGATGYLGCHLLVQLLLNTNSELYCLVRAQNQEDAAAKLRHKVSYYYPNVDLPFDRVHLILGDITRQSFELSENEWEALSVKIDSVFHCAADVRHVGDRQAFIAVNEVGTKNVLSFCSERSQKFLHHISTTAVMGLSHDDGNFTEDDLAVGQYFVDHYSESKFLAECAVRQFQQSGGAANIYRIGTIGACSNGIFQENIAENYFTRLVRSLINLKVAPYLPDYFLDYQEVDLTARSVIALGTQHKGATFHLYNEKTLGFYELCCILQSFGYSIRIISYEDFLEVLPSLSNEISFQEDLGGLFELFNHRDVKARVMQNTFTTNILKQDNLSFQRPDAEQLWRIIQHGIAVGYFPNIPYGNYLKPLKIRKEQYGSFN